MILHCTKKLLRRLPAQTESAPPSASRLGDWHATLLVWKPSWLVLAINDASRLPVLLPARELSTMLARFPEAASSVLTALGIEAQAIGRERKAMQPIVVAPSSSRSVLGTMNDFVFQLEWIRHREPERTLLDWSLRLADTPVGPSPYIHPPDVARRMLVGVRS